MKRALITGITGQDGSYLAELLLKKGYEVHGIRRRSSSFNTGRIDHLFEGVNEQEVKLDLHYGDLSDASALRHIISKVKPDEVYNLAAQSHVGLSFLQPEYTFDVGATGCLRLLDAVRDYAELSGKQVKFYQAGSSEMFGSTPPPQTEISAFHPRSPYAVAKAAAHYHVQNYREAYGMFGVNGILFNHESPRRGETFVTRKITRAATRIKLGLQKKLYLGNLDAKRDWGFAGDYVKAMWMMLQHDQPDDYVVCTGESYSVQHFVEKTFSALELNWKEFVEIDPKYIRPAEVDSLKGVAAKAESVLGWKPSVDCDALIKMMVDSDLELAKNEKVLQGS